MALLKDLFYAQLRLCVVFCTFFCQLAADDVLEAVWADAEKNVLWDDPEWWTLGHYHRTMWGRVESRVDDDAFFIHPKGKTHRKAELYATLQAFLHPESEAVERSVSCRFPARRKWLLRKLNLPDDVFPAGDCETYLQAVDDLEIESATLIYPAAYLNSPASMFGHLLLVLDRKGKDRLLSRAVNYAAIVGDSFGPLFAVKGIFGLYDGVYTILPYYDKVEEYSSVNRRDIWEYPLELSGEELDMLMRHVWELQELKSRYFFFKENCAFNLVYPIQVARPSLEMVRRFRVSAVPVSLLQQLVRTGITRPPIFRPSKATVMAQQWQALDTSEISRAKKLVEGAELQDSDSPEVITFATEWIQFLYTEKEMTPAEYRERIFPLLRARSKLGKMEAKPIDPPVSPDQGHAPRRLTAYAGVNSTKGEGIAGLKVRAAYHDWLDDPAGYPPGSSIRMFEMDIQGSLEDKSVFLNELTLVNIRSQTPPSPWVNPLSWAVDFSVEAAPFDKNHHRSYGRFASGLTRNLPQAGYGYLMLSQQVMFDSGLDHNLSWEPGLEWGVVFPGQRVRFGLRGWHYWGVLGFDEQRHEVESEVRASVRRNKSFGLSMRYREEMNQQETLFALHFYQTF